MRWKRIKLVTGGLLTVVSAAAGYRYWRQWKYGQEVQIVLQPTGNWDTDWDKREPKSLIKPISATESDKAVKENYANELKSQKATATRNLILIRHGQYDSKATDSKDKILTTLGRTQAYKLGERLKELNYPFRSIISSTLPRAVQTTEEVHKHFPDLPITYEDCLREGFPVVPHPPMVDFRPPKLYHVDGARIEYAFRRFFHRAPPDQKEESYELLICHANVIRYFVCRALQISPELWLRLSLHHASITWIRIKPNGNVVLMSLGDSGYLPPDEVTRT